MKAVICPNFNLIIWKREAGRIVLSRLRCKKWSCDYCANLNRLMWRTHLKKRIGQLGGEWWFITITAAEWYREAAKSLENLRRGLDLLFKRIRRVFGKVEYVRVYETHKTGVFHAHIIMSNLSGRVAYGRARSGKRCYKPTEKRGLETWSISTWFKKTCRACKMGYMVDIQAVQGIPKVVNYLCKYITKEGQNFNVGGLRRIQTSQGIGAANSRVVGGGWTVAQHVWAGDVKQMQLYDANLKLVINPSYFIEHMVYPNDE